MHGVKFIGEKNRSIAERVFWIIAFMLSTVLLGWMAFDTWNKWRTSPVIISIARKPLSVWEIPFPAITICPESNVNYQLFNFTSAYNRLDSDAASLTTEESNYFEALSQMCFTELFDKNLSSSLDAADIASVIKSIRLTVDDVVDDVFWEDEDQSKALFTGQMMIFENKT